MGKVCSAELGKQRGTKGGDVLTAGGSQSSLSPVCALPGRKLLGSSSMSGAKSVDLIVLCAAEVHRAQVLPHTACGWLLCFQLTAECRTHGLQRPAWCDLLG